MQGPNPVGLLYVTGKSLDFILSAMRSDGFKQMSDDLTYFIRFLKIFIYPLSLCSQLCILKIPGFSTFPYAPTRNDPSFSWCSS